MRVRIDREQAERVFSRLLKALRGRQPPYDRAKPPQEKENLPETLSWGGRAHAIFLFCSCYWMRGGIKSETAIRSLGKVFTEAPELFNPADFDGNIYKEEEVQEIFCRAGLGFHVEEIVRFWLVNFRKLERFWGGDPCNLYSEVSDYEVLCDRVIHDRNKPHREDNPQGFFGFREKMVSMLTYFLADAGFVDPFVFPVPVDFHVMRVLVSNEILILDGERIPVEEVAVKARELTLNYCRETGTSPLELCNALWLLSSSSCNQNPANQSQEIGERVGRGTKVSSREVEWSEALTRTYWRTCGSCPLGERGIDTCQHAVPSAVYYVNGEIRIRGRVERASQLTIDF